jgi:hypothetical protein
MQSMVARKTSKKHSSNTTHAWFRPLRGSYIPVHWKGWLTYVPYVAYLYFTYMLLVPNRSLLETILFLVPYWVAGVIVMHWVAKQKS